MTTTPTTNTPGAVMRTEPDSDPKHRRDDDPVHEQPTAAADFSISAEAPRPMLTFARINELQRTLEQMVNATMHLRAIKPAEVRTIVVRLTIDNVPLACVFNGTEWAAMVDD